MKHLALILVTVVVIAVILYHIYPRQNVVVEGPEETISFRDLSTDTSLTSIDLKQVLSGGPGKDGIPALNNPKFISPRISTEDDSTRGILVNLKNTQRFYPYSILVWHEIVNDEIGDIPFSVTFCPLCDSGIVFDRRVNGEVLQFGVSGLLFESNLLMYDTKTESLWSQARGEAVVGKFNGTKLTLLPLQVITFKEARAKYPNLNVLSRETGYRRNYENPPYAGYEESDGLIFPVSVDDKRFFSKEPFYVIPFNGKSVAFPYRRLKEGESEFNVDGKTITINRNEDEIFVESGGESFPGYFEFWFSWAIHHQDDGVVLDL